MKITRLLALVAVSVFGQSVNAADLVVQQGGPAGTYGSITAAMTAATDGDRIVIVNKPGGQSWDESFTVTKALQFVSAQDGVNWIVRGNITISPSTTAKTISFTGMENLQGNISTGTVAPAGARVRLDVVGSVINGSLNINASNYFANFAGNTITNGNITITYGRVLGNVLNVTTNNPGFSQIITLSSDAQSNNDSVQIGGNKITTPFNGSTALYGIVLNSSSQFVQVFNNSIRTNYTGIYFTNIKNSALAKNTVINNSIYLSTNNFSNVYAIWFTGVNAPLALADVLNNAFQRGSSFTGGFLLNSGSLNYSVLASYNLSGGSGVSTVTSNSSITPDATNTWSSALAIDAEGRPNAPATDAGHPGGFYTDLDRTRNDAGAYGGSYTIDNFFPNGTAGAPRVYMVRMPRAIYQGNTIRVEADGYDK